MKPKIVLASASPRRRALLAALGVEFDGMATDAPERFEGASPSDLVIENARSKRDEATLQIDAPAIIIAADTLVFLDAHVLGKPVDAEEAHAMLQRLSGRTHQVLTGLSLVDTATGKTAEGYEATDVQFRPLSPHEITQFVEAVNPLDRAGAYTVDGPGSLLVQGYHGCYQNVLGFPIVRLDQLLRELGVFLFDCMDGSRAVFL